MISSQKKLNLKNFGTQLFKFKDKGFLLVLLFLLFSVFSVQAKTTPVNLNAADPKEVLETYRSQIFMMFHVSFNQSGYLNMLLNVTPYYTLHDQDPSVGSGALFVLDNATSTAFHLYVLEYEDVTVYSNFTTMKEKTPPVAGAPLEKGYNTTFGIGYPFSIDPQLQEDDPNLLRFIIYFEGEQGSMDVAIIKDWGWIGVYDGVSDSPTQDAGVAFALPFSLISLLSLVFMQKKIKRR